MKRGLIGYPLGHSSSPFIHYHISHQNYELFPITEEELIPFLKQKDFLGVNVTIPYKEKVLPLLDFIDDKARRIGAVNTILQKDNKLYGYNTDYDGFLFLLKYHNIKVFNKNILILGTGGTSKTVYQVVKDLGASKINKVSRNKQSNYYTYDSIYLNQELLTSVQIIINTTPVGMSPRISESPLELSKFSSVETVIDVIYNPIKTKMMLDAKKLKIKNVVNGLIMLVAQGVKSAEYFDECSYSRKTIQHVYQKVFLNSSNIVFIGMPGSGKSTVGKIVAKKLRMPFIDLDEAFFLEYQQTPEMIISSEGINAFREKETIIAKKIASKKHCVIATGGGIVTKDENYYQFCHNSLIIYLNRVPSNSTLANHRPLSKNINDWYELYNERKELYEKWMDVKIDSKQNINDTVNEILKVIKLGGKK